MLHKKYAYLLAGSLLYLVAFTNKQYSTNFNGQVEFVSIAPQETIRANSQKLKGAVDWDNGLFLFSIDINSFMGFNNPLQREHFNENYMESHIYPQAVFKGKIIEDFTPELNKTYHIRAKGKLEIHGVAKEKIINVELRVTSKSIIAQSEFKVLLSDYNIKIPRIVSEKLSSEINVKVNAVLENS